MMLITPLVLFLLALLHLGAANFDVYQIQEINAVDGSIFQEWTVFPDKPDCNEVFNYPTEYWLDKDDVSGKKINVRCEPPQGCSSGKAERIDILEMNFNDKYPVYHWTIYKNKNFDMYGLDGGVAGHCIVFPGDGFQCSRVIYNVGGVRKFQCLTTITAQQLVDASRLRLEREGKSANTTSAHHFNDSE